MSKLRMLLADDHEVLREGLKLLINSQPDMEVIAEASDGMSAWQQAKECRPDVVIMDVSMPRMDGAKATERLKRECPEVKVLALTAHEDKGYISRLVRAGASGYLLKVAAASELIKAIRVVAAGGIYLDPALADKVVNNYMRQQSLKGEAQHGTLTAREEEVLRLVARGYVNKEIAARLNLSVKTVEAHKSNFMEKLDLHSRADTVRYALSQGWLLPEG
ncbi:MAG: response regulator transcription factor [Acidobacteria bacterium]|nr:response regulator transcription factor [Acidobacteriota bacterium]